MILQKKANAKQATYRTRSGRAIGHKSGMYNPVTGQNIKWTEMATVLDEDKDSKNYYNVLGINENKERVFEDSRNKFIEFINVGAGIGEEFSNTQELQVMKYHEAINGPDGGLRKEEMAKEHKRMVDSRVFEPVKISKVPNGVKLIDTT